MQQSSNVGKRRTKHPTMKTTADRGSAKQQAHVTVNTQKEQIVLTISCTFYESRSESSQQHMRQSCSFHSTGMAHTRIRWQKGTEHDVRNVQPKASWMASLTVRFSWLRLWLYMCLCPIYLTLALERQAGTACHHCCLRLPQAGQSPDAAGGVALGSLRSASVLPRSCRAEACGTLLETAPASASLCAPL